MTDLTIQGRHGDQPGVTPVYSERVTGAGYSPTEIKATTLAEMRANKVCQADVYVVSGIPGYFVWNSSSTATDDGTSAATAIQITGITTGRYLKTGTLSLNGTPVSGVVTDGSLVVTPNGSTGVLSSANKDVAFSSSGGGDDFARLQTLCDSLIGTGSTIVFQPGTFHCTGDANEFRLKKGHPKWRASAAVRFVVSQTKTPSLPTPSMVFSPGAYAPGQTTVATGAVVGDMALTVASITVPVISAGTMIEIAGSVNNFGTMYRVQKAPVANGGNWDLALDRPIRVACGAGVIVKVLSDYVDSWEFDGGGCSISGVSCRHLSLARNWKSVVKNVIFDDVDGVPSDLCSYDNDGVQNLFQNLEYRSTTGAVPDTAGLLCETNEGTKIVGCKMGDCGITVPGGICIESCIDCVVEESTAYSILISCEQAKVATGNVVSGGSYRKFQLGQATPTNQIRNTTFRGVHFGGVKIGAGPTANGGLICPTWDTTLEKCNFDVALLRSYGISLGAYDQTRLVLKECVFDCNRESYTAVAQADKCEGLSIAAGGTHSIVLDRCSFKDMEAVTFAGVSLDLSASDSRFDNSLTGTAATALFRLYGTSAKIQLTRCTGTVYSGSYTAINGTTTMTVMETDCVMAGTWLTAAGTTTGYKRGQTTQATSNGTWTTTAW